MQKTFSRYPENVFSPWETFSALRDKFFAVGEKLSPSSENVSQLSEEIFSELRSCSGERKRFFFWAKTASAY